MRGTALLALALAATGVAAQEPVMLDAQLAEISGMARSLADPQILWAHNDSGNASVLYRLGPSGESLGAVPLRGGRLLDWEDIAAFRWRGRPALLLADVGDNLAARGHVSLYAVSDPGRSGAAELLWTLDFRYVDGARDCEGLVVDAAGGEILLLTKRDRPPRLYRLPLPQTPPRGLHTATLLGDVKGIPAAPGSGHKGALKNRWLHRPSALALADDGRSAVIVTPGRAYRYRRAPGQSWLAALNGAAQAIDLPTLPQIEAGALSADGRTLYVASEGRPPAFARVALP